MGNCLTRDLIYKNLGKNISFPVNLLRYNRKSLKKKRYNLYFYIQSSHRSTRISVVNSLGQTLLSVSVGSLFKKSNRKGAFAATRLFYLFVKSLRKLNTDFSAPVICFKGFGPGRRVLMKFFRKIWLKKHSKKKSYIVDLTTIPFNGCRLKKSRRL